jgi:hypothetical protein
LEPEKKAFFCEFVSEPGDNLDEWDFLHNETPLLYFTYKF